MKGNKFNVCATSLLGALVVLVVSVFVGCGVPETPLPTVSKEERALVVKASNYFAFDLYRELAKSDQGNLFISPYSISTALTMTYAGARSETASEMAKTLHVSADQKEVHQANNWLLIDLNNRGQRGNYELAIANRLWGQKDYNFLKDFLETLDKFYLAAMGEVDFMKATEDARQTINKWVEDKTRDRIKELIPQGILSAATVLVLTNAIYFKGTWLQKFKPEDTKDLPFHTSPTDTVNVPTMYQNNDKALYADVDDLQILELPYKGDEISMMLVVPKQKDGLAALETSLSSEKFDAWRSKLQKQEKVELYLPKFKLTKDFNLNQPLKNLGMVKAFTDADFSGINGQKDLFIQAVLHKAFVEINEEGTEAAAATAVVVGRTSVEPSHPVIRADRPFVFALFDRTTNCILFIGRVANPAKAE